MKSTVKTNIKKRKQKELGVAMPTSLVSSAATSSSEADNCTEIKFTKIIEDHNVRKRQHCTSLPHCSEGSTQSRPANKYASTNNMTELDGNGKQETVSETCTYAESSISQRGFPQTIASSDSFTEYLHMQMIQDPQFIVGLTEDHEKIDAQKREDRRSSLRILPSRDCAYARRAADCMEGIFDPIKAMLDTLQELRKSNKELEDRIAVLTARRDQLLMISGVISEMHQSYLHHHCWQNEVVEESNEGFQQSTEDPQQSSEDPQQPSEDLQQQPSEGPGQPSEGPGQPSENPHQPSEDPQLPSEDSKQFSEDLTS